MQKAKRKNDSRGKGERKLEAEEAMNGERKQ